MNFEEFRNLDLAEIGQWPRPAKLVVWVVMVLLLWMLGYRIFIAPSLDRLEATRRQEPQLKQEFEQKTAMAARLQARPAGEASPAAGGLTQLPEASEDNDVANLLEDITRLGRNNGLGLQFFKPEPEIHKGFYAELPIRIGVTGNYHQFGHFISDLAALPRIVTVDGVRISRIDKNQGNGLKMEMVVHSYHAEAPKPAAKGQGGGR